jgi:hypothetical protein
MRARLLRAVLAASLAGAAGAQCVDLTVQRQGDDLVFDSPCPPSDLWRWDGALSRGTPSHVATGVTFPFTLAGGALVGPADADRVVYALASDPVPGRDAAVRIRLHLDAIRLFPGWSRGNIYHVAVPAGAIADVARSSPDTSDKCVGDPGGPLMGDGFVNADDLVCTLWTSRQGGIVVRRWDPVAQAWTDRSAFVDDLTGEVLFVGPWTGSLLPEEGIRVDVSSPARMGPGRLENTPVLVGWHDGSAPPVHLDGAAMQLVVLGMPGWAMQRSSDQALCGLWSMDPDLPEDADTCDPGLDVLFDGAHAVQISAYDNGDLDQFVGRGVDEAFNRLHFWGPRFDLVPGDAYLVWLSRDHVPADFSFAAP